jgi:hypothetical protein
MGTAADGANGGSFVFNSAVGATTTATPVTAGGVTTFTLTWPGTFSSGSALAAALNALAPFNTLFVANGVGGAPAASVAAPFGFTAGTTTYAVAVPWSKPVVPGVQDTTAPYTFSNGVGPGMLTAVLPNGAPVAAAQVSADVIIFTTDIAAQQFVPGTTTLTITGVVTDFAGNTMTSPTTVTLS